MHACTHGDDDNVARFGLARLTRFRIHQHPGKECCRRPHCASQVRPKQRLTLLGHDELGLE